MLKYNKNKQKANTHYTIMRVSLYTYMYSFNTNFCKYTNLKKSKTTNQSS